MKYIMLMGLLFFVLQMQAQVNIPHPEDSLKEYESVAVSVYTDDYLKKYNRYKRIIVKVYPYALFAADIIDEIDQNAESINKRRKKNKFYRQSYHELKEEFKYFILDLCTSEGKMLMKLIHRETGMTVYDISNKYRGRQKAEMFNLMAKIWDQDLHVKFEPEVGDDKIAETVIQDIQSGLITFDDKVVTVDKLTYKEKQKENKIKRKKAKKKRKDYLKRKKKRERQKKKVERKKEN
ncbi:MAG: DUF4294 domain-containing protein [Crocinitomicaceae bacterium]